MMTCVFSHGTGALQFGGPCICHRPDLFHIFVFLFWNICQGVPYIDDGWILDVPHGFGI